MSVSEPKGWIEDARSRDDSMDDYNSLLAMLGELDDRGLVLTLSAFAEENLGGLLKSFMLQNKAAEKLLEGFNAPFGTFSSRIQACFAFGLITAEQYNDLERLRKIRNEFAHTWKKLSLKDTPIASIVQAVNYCPYSGFPGNERDKIRICFSWLLMEIKVATTQTIKKRRSVELIGFHLVPGLSGDIDRQIAEVREDLARLETDILTARGEKLKFLHLVRRNWAVRLEYVERAAPSDRKGEVIAIREELLRRLAERG